MADSHEDRERRYINRARAGDSQKSDAELKAELKEKLKTVKKRIREGVHDDLMKKAVQQQRSNSAIHKKRENTETDKGPVTVQASKRAVGQKIPPRPVKEDIINEIGDTPKGRGVLRNYAAKAIRSGQDEYIKSSNAKNQDERKKHVLKARKRLAGNSKAINKLRATTGKPNYHPGNDTFHEDYKPDSIDLQNLRDRKKFLSLLKAVKANRSEEEIEKKQGGYPVDESSKACATKTFNKRETRLTRLSNTEQKKDTNMVKKDQDINEISINKLDNYEEQENLIKAVIDQKPLDAQDAFDAMMKERLADMLDVYKSRILADEFGGEKAEEIDDMTTGDDDEDLSDEQISELLGDLSDEELEVLLKDLETEPEPDTNGDQDEGEVEKIVDEPSETDKDTEDKT